MSLLRDDRGLHYGDGLFETIRFVGRQAPFWDWHMQRLLLGSDRLGLPRPDVSTLLRRTRRAAAPLTQSIVKLIWTAGSGLRGYARPLPMRGRALLYATRYTPVSSAGLRLRWCTTRLGAQPALAGIKHLNRLEQVLARAEWAGSEFDEGLMLNMQGQVIAATAANLFARVDGRWFTPPVNDSGIAGVARRWLMSQVDVTESALTPAALCSAQACVLTNAVRGPQRVASLDSVEWSVDPQVQSLIDNWSALFAVNCDVSSTL